MSFLINPYGFAGAGGIGAGSYAVTRVALRTTTGTQDITVTGFGTPKAAYFITSLATSDGVAIADASGSLGATDGTRQWSASFWSDDARGIGTVGAGIAATDEVIQLCTSGGSFIEANFDSWITDGVRINVGQTNGAAVLVTVILFGGSSLQAYANTITLANDGIAVTATPGFQLRALLTGSIESAFNDTVRASNAVLIGGLASYDGSTIRQAVQSYAGINNDPTVTRGGVRNDAVFARPASLATAYATLQNITATQFDLLCEGSLGTMNVGYLALGGINAWAGVLDAPTATGNHDFTGPSFQPTLAVTIPTMLSAVNTQTDNGDASGWAYSAITAAAQYCNAFADQDAVGTSNTQSISDDVAVNLDTHAQAAAFDATFDSFLSNGVRLNFTAANGTVRKWPMLFLS